MNRLQLIDAAWKLPELDSMPKRRFVEWLIDNFAIYRHFRKFAKEAIASKRKRFSAYMIRERVRWYVNVEYRGECKIQNNVTPYIARLLAEEFPELKTIFSSPVTFYFPVQRNGQ